MDDLRTFLSLSQRNIQAEIPQAEKYLQSRGYPLQKFRDWGLGYYKGTYNLPIQDKSFKLYLWKWGETPAMVYPLRTLGGSVLGFQLGALERSKYDDFFLEGAGDRGLFFYPSTFDWECFHRHGKVVLVEGCLDALALSTALRCVLSCLSARLTRGQSRGVKRWTQQLFCAYDNDSKGEEAYEKVKHFWDVPRTSLHRITPLLKDPQDMLERDPKHLVAWSRSWAPSELWWDP